MGADKIKEIPKHNIENHNKIDYLIE